MSRVCMYCGKASLLAPMYEVYKAVKTTGDPYSYSRFGLCCEKCEAAGNQTTIYPERDT